ncbi:uncharacterized protein LOC130405715 [Gadus chalcogrammus]|uniref:uncharacterized protein LOC130405715 n=1 Tax=Gadus chalcogrammus TaxID=1042646 RepID=UPI0024C4868E|nr:uncharacterized protein LOC130405715 [Gadus chalcogrammus]
MIKWREFDLRLSRGKTLDHIEMTALEAERKRWRDVLTRLISITQSLAERNLAFRGSSDKLFQLDNGNFLKEVELLAKFDPVLENHVSRIKDGDTHAHYLSKDIQNELIQLVSDRILKTIVTQVRDSKYFSIILDCTPDISHQEQMSIILRSVALKGQPEIKEHFLGFVNVEATTGLNLSTVILDKLTDLKIPFDDCRGQAYDNGANMKGRHQGVQARLLQKNPRAVFVPCDAQTTARSICEEMNVEAVLKDKRLRTSKRHFSYEAPDEPVADALQNLEVNFFNIVVDSTIASIDERFETLNQVKTKYGVVLNFSTACQMSSDSLKGQCMQLEKTLTFNQDCDISGVNLANEIKTLPDLPSVASAERSFSKLKLIKSYLRSSMSQERLSGLAIMSINHDRRGSEETRIQGGDADPETRIRGGDEDQGKRRGSRGDTGLQVRPAGQRVTCGRSPHEWRSDQGERLMDELLRDKRTGG